jgi:cell division protein FtsA
MGKYSFTLYLEINNSNFIFSVEKKDEKNNLEIVNNIVIPIEGIEKNRINDLKKIFQVLKENIYLIEQKLNFTFKEIILIIENFNPTFINLSGYKKLNGSQILKENIIYILNTLKSYVDKIESKKTVIHIFNSKFNLDNEKIENLPIGLFGDFYSHEISLILMDTNDYKNLCNIFDQCNLKVKKIFLKSFIKGANISNKNKDLDTFFHIKLSNKNSKILFFENNSLKTEQDFKFNTDIILQDICKITSLKKETVELILGKIHFTNHLQEDEILDKDLFQNDNFRKIKKKLIYEIALARILEISEIMLSRNINFKSYVQSTKNIFLELDCKLQFYSLGEIYKTVFSNYGKWDLKFLDDMSNEDVINTSNQIVHYGWKTEAIPVTQNKKSMVARLFDTIFN